MGRRIREAIRRGRYEFSLHALEEMDEDDMIESDVRSILLHGRVTMRLLGDARGTRFVVQGALGSFRAEVVCRFLPSGRLRIVTAYRMEP